MRNSILIALMAIIGICPLKGQNHDIHIYLNNGDIHSFFYDRADSITFNTSNEQCIWTADSTYTVNINEIDSITIGERELPLAFYKEDFAGWSDVLFCKNGAMVFHAEKTNSESERSLMFLPDDEYGVICSYARYNDNSFPVVMTFNDDVYFLSEQGNGLLSATVVQGDSLIYRIDSIDGKGYYDMSRRGIRRSWSENNGVRNFVAISDILLGLTQSVSGGFVIIGSIPIGSMQGGAAGGIMFLGGVKNVQDGLNTIFVPAVSSSTGVDNYTERVIFAAGQEACTKGLMSEKGREYLIKVMPKGAKNFLEKPKETPKWTSYLFVGELTLKSLDAAFGETVAKADRAVMHYLKWNVETGIAKNITPYSATVRGYISPELTYGENGESIDVEYGVTIKGNGEIYNKKFNNENGGLIEFDVDFLTPGCEYTYFTYIWNTTDAVLRFGEYKTFTTLSLPTAETGDHTEPTKTSTTVTCTYNNIPEDAECGVEYFWNNDYGSIVVDATDGQQTITLSNLFPGTKYHYRAYVKAYGQTFYGKKEEFTTESVLCTVTLTDFKVIHSQHKTRGFENEGVYYDYSFRASVTATLETEEPLFIKEWGYVYEDPYKNKKEIPLKSFGTTYTDSSYAYYRNTPNSTARLYGYVYIVGSDKPIYGEVNDFPLNYYSPVATTGECNDNDDHSVTITCTYENVQEGGICGIEFKWDGGSMKHEIGLVNGVREEIINGLSQGVSYNYRAYIEVEGETFYGEWMYFKKATKAPELTGTWKCTIIDWTESVMEEPILEFSSNGDVKISGSSQTPENIIGKWSGSEDGSVSIYFSYIETYGKTSFYYSEYYSGKVDVFSNPSVIEGNVKRITNVTWSPGLSSNNAFIMRRM
ncbi:MAG: hypothetical protein II826_01170 [Prevotella sp.]|nr:hypothetical protein [Prevotella sp.]